MIERAILCEGLAGLIRVNALELGDGPKSFRPSGEHEDRMYLRPPAGRSWRRRGPQVRTRQAMICSEVTR